MRIMQVVPPFQPVDTSITAAVRVVPKLKDWRWTIYTFLQGLGSRGATAGEIATELALNPSTVRPRLRELEGTAPWAKGKLPARIIRTPERRAGMRVYQACAVTPKP